MFKISYVFSEECTVVCFNHIKVKQHLQEDQWQCTVFRDNNEFNTQEHSAVVVNVLPLKQSDCPLVLVAQVRLEQPCQESRRGEEDHLATTIEPFG
jgi:hypothetical protein